MSDSQITLREVFEVPQPGAPEPPPDRWQTFQTKIVADVKSIKTAAMPDLMDKVGELLDVPIPNILLASWKKAGALQSLLEESRKSPETVMSLELCEHSINSEHKPCIEVKVRSVTVKKIDFTLRLAFNLKGFVLTIQKGAIKKVQTGACEVQGTMEYEGIVVAEKKLAPIHLPGSLPMPDDDDTNDGAQDQKKI